MQCALTLQDIDDRVRRSVPSEQFLRGLGLLGSFFAQATSVKSSTDVIVLTGTGGRARRGLGPHASTYRPGPGVDDDRHRLLGNGLRGPGLA